MSIKAFRVEWLTLSGRHGPTGYPIDAPTCHRNPAHSPPAPRCTCGIYAVDDVSDLATLLESCERTQADAVIRRAGNTPSGPRSIRLAVVEGDLADPVHTPGPPPPGVRRVLVLEGSNIGVSALLATVPAAWTGGGGGPVRYGVVDPHGTWRGSAFTPVRAILQAQAGDDHADLYREILGGVERVCVEVQHDPARLLSKIVERYAASSRTDDEWWTA